MAIEAATLHQLRIAEGRTQQEVAERMRSSQPAVGRIERKHDVLVSTMRKFAAALGGRLDLVVSFPDGREFRINHNRRDD